MTELTAKQRAFVEAYNGNATEAALAAGYSEKTAPYQGCKLLKNRKVAAALQERQDKESRERIATRQRRQEFWTEVMESGKAEMRDRLKASELLGKSEGDFLDRHDHTSSDGSMTPAAPVDLSHLTVDELTALAKVVFSGESPKGEEC